jgi:hypothetical protein
MGGGVTPDWQKGDGLGGWTRTSDPLLRSQQLFQLSYAEECHARTVAQKRDGRKRLPSDSRRATLPIEMGTRRVHNALDLGIVFGS